MLSTEASLRTAVPPKKKKTKKKREPSESTHMQVNAYTDQFTYELFMRPIAFGPPFSGTFFCDLSGCVVSALKLTLPLFFPIHETHTCIPCAIHSPIPLCICGICPQRRFGSGKSVLVRPTSRISHSISHCRRIFFESWVVPSELHTTQTFIHISSQLCTRNERR
jgi:hypothetical protein